MTEAKRKRQQAEVIPLYGRDEMNLVEFPFGPITKASAKTLEVEHPVFDRRLKREVMRKLIITGSDAFGLPRPIDDQVLVGMMALSHEARYASRQIEFSRYYLCRILGWGDNGRSYRRLEESFDRIAGTTLKFRDAWWDKGNEVWQSRTFHLIEEVSLCSKDGLDSARMRTGKIEQALCSFVWNETVWKSFQDGFIKSLDMEMFRRISKGRRREVPLRLFRILDKRFYNKSTVFFDLRHLSVGKLGLSAKYTPYEMLRVLERAVRWLNECGYRIEMSVPEGNKRRSCDIAIRKTARVGRVPKQQKRVQGKVAKKSHRAENEQDEHQRWLAEQIEEELIRFETEALDVKFGSELQKNIVLQKRREGMTIFESGSMRQWYIRDYMESTSA